MRVTVLGSGSLVELPTDVDSFVRNGYLIDRRNGSLMEMDAIGLYSIAEILKEKDKIRNLVINGICTNLNASKDFGFWKHGVWGHDEVHLRFTSSALRLLLLIDNSQELHHGLDKNELLLKHLEYSELLDEGRWFFHDSIEPSCASYPQAHINNKCLGSSLGNMMILNTHLDTMTTLLMYQYSCHDKAIDAYITDSIKALDFYIESASKLPLAFEKIDGIIRNNYLKLFGNKKLVSKIIRGGLSVLYYRKIRLLFKKVYNVALFSDGYIERDLCLGGPSFDYHVVNIWDLARVLTWLNNAKKKHLLRNYMRILDILNNGISYAISDNYLCYMKNYEKGHALVSEVLETLVLSFDLGLVSEENVKGYFKLRNIYPRSIGLLGLDPVNSGLNCFDLIKDYSSYFPSNINIDIIPLAQGGVFVANVSNGEFEIKRSLFNIRWTSSKFGNKLKNGDMAIVDVLGNQ